LTIAAAALVVTAASVEAATAIPAYRAAPVVAVAAVVSRAVAVAATTMVVIVGDADGDATIPLTIPTGWTVNAVAVVVMTTAAMAWKAVVVDAVVRTALAIRVAICAISVAMLVMVMVVMVVVVVVMIMLSPGPIATQATSRDQHAAHQEAECTSTRCLFVQAMKLYRESIKCFAVHALLLRAARQTILASTG
jgi:hypothetical protein